MGGAVPSRMPLLAAAPRMRESPVACSLSEGLLGIGCDDEAAVEQVLDALEAILLNRHDGRRDHALAVLVGLSQPSGPAGDRLLRLRAEYGAREVAPTRDDRYRNLTHPDDGGWSEALDELTSPQGSRRNAYDFSRSLLSVFGNRLRSASAEDKREFLSRHRAIFVDVVRRLGHRLPASDAVRLKQWIAESSLMRLDELHSLACTERRAERWEDVSRFAREIDTELQGDDQRLRVGEVLSQAEDYARWRKQFDDLLRVLEGHEFRDRPLFPWSPPEDLEHAPAMTLDRLERSVAGLETWGSAEDSESLDRALMTLTEAALNDFCRPGPKPIHDAIRCFEDLRAQWPSCLGALRHRSEWESVTAELKSQLDMQVEAWFVELRGGFVDRASFLDALEAHQGLREVGPMAGASTDAHRRQVDQLDVIRRDLRIWWDGGNGSLLKDTVLIRRENELASLSPLWGRSPGYRALDAELLKLKDELGRMAEAERLLHDGDLAQADAVLSQCGSPPAFRLRRHAEQVGRDERIRRAIEAGRITEIRPEDVEVASAEVRERYACAVRADAYMEQMRRELGPLVPGSDLVASAESLLVAQGRKVPDNVELGEPAKRELERLRQSAYERVIDAAANEIARVRSEVRFYPLLEESALSEYQRQLEGIRALIQSSAIHPAEASQLEQDIAPLGTALGVHRACAEQDWDRADALLAPNEAVDFLDDFQRRELLATLSTARLLHEGSASAQAEWLEHFREYSDVVMHHAEPRSRYLRLIRSIKESDPAVDLPILTRWFPEERYLYSLLACLVDARRADEVDGAPMAADEPVFRRLLDELSRSAFHYYQVRRLWGFLSEEARKRLWTNDQTPIDRVESLLKVELGGVEEKLADPAVRVSELRLQIDDLLKTNLISRKTVEMLDAAADIERYMRDFERSDPWADALKRDILEADRISERLPLKIRAARGWSDAIRSRWNGIKAWDGLEVSWSQFRERFDRGSTEFHLDPEHWQEFKALVRDWIQAIDQAMPNLEWSLPRSSESERWRSLIMSWKGAPEGVLALEAGSTLPGDLPELRERFVAVAEQIESFAALHAGLLEEPAKARLQQLHLVRPLSRPVQRIRLQLTNPDVAYAVGTAYRRFLDDLETS